VRYNGDMESEFLSIKEVATILNVSQLTIRNAIKDHLIPFIRIGNKPKSPYRISKRTLAAIHEGLIKGFKK
jgi:excisionase family DNA binding protein